MGRNMVCAWIALLATTAALADFTAYNDLGGNSGGNTTSISLGGAGLLRDFATGASTPVTLNVVAGSPSPGVDNSDSNGSMPNSGTDAHSVFNGFVDLRGYVWYSAEFSSATLTFAGLNPSSQYELVLTGNRNNSAYTDRITLFTLSDVDAFTSSHSAGTTLVTVNQANDSVQFTTGYNTLNGYVARWTGIRSGADGDMAVRVGAPAGSNGRWYLNGLKLVEAGAGPSGTVISFQEGASGYAGTVDTFLKGSTPTDPYGTEVLNAWDGDDAGAPEIGLLRFNGIFGAGVGQIPLGAAIQSATLSYHVINAGHTATVNEVAVDWDENVTYQAFGGDAGLQVDEYAANVGTANGALGTQSLNVTASIAAWAANPAANRGWVFRPTGGTDGVEFLSSENADSANRPKLTVVYMLTDRVSLAPRQLDAVVGAAARPITVAIPPGSNTNSPVQVTLTTDQPEVATPVGAVGGSLLVTFAAGAAREQSVDIAFGSAGSASIATSNDAGLEDDNLTVDVTDGLVTFAPGELNSLNDTMVPLDVSISTGSNDTRPVTVTLAADHPAIAVPDGAVSGSLALLFPAGGPATQTVNVLTGQPGLSALRTANDAGLNDAVLPVRVIHQDWITLTVNPYANVDWVTFEQHKANLHTHTNRSDGDMDPATVIDLYHQRGYTILSITDHDLCTWPWTDWGRDPVALGMLAIPGNEYSQHHHLNGFFLVHQTGSTNVDQTLAEIGAAGGLSKLNHPGRYTNSLHDYLGWYTSFDHLMGMEVINQGGRYVDLVLWDQVLSELMPERPVWGLAGDDMHKMEHVGRDWDMFLIPELSEQNVRSALDEGQYYFSSVYTHPVGQQSVTQTPRIESITHDPVAGTITVSSTSGGQPLTEPNYRWISRGTVVQQGSTINYRTTPGVGNYVRVELTGQGGTTYSNPFGIASVLPGLELSTDLLDRSVHLGDELAVDSFTVRNSGPATVNYTITEDADWLSVQPTSGDSSGEADSINVVYDVSGLPTGEYSATITVASPDAFNPPQTIVVSVAVVSVKPDFDGDGDVDHEDFGHLQTCFSGSGIQSTPACVDARLDADLDVDSGDLIVFVRCMSGPNHPAERTCDD